MTWEIGPGSDVILHFTIRLEDGTVVETTDGGPPLHFTMGDGTLTRGLELALYGLRPGSRQTIRIPPSEGYGYPDPGQIMQLKRNDFPREMQISKGSLIAFDAGAEQIAGVVLELDDTYVRVDLNHPLAGHEIQFDTEIIEVGPPIGFK